MGYAGSLSTAQLTQDLAKKSFAGAFIKLYPNGTAPLFALSALAKSSTAVATEHGFFTKTFLIPSIKVTSAAAGGATTLTVADSSNAVAGQLYRNNTTGEVVIINSVVSATSITVTRGLGTVATTTIAVNTVLSSIGTGFEEGSVRPAALNVTPVRVTNLTQIFRDSWALTDTVRNVITIAGGTNLQESQQDAAALHAANIERALIWGVKYQGTRNGQPFRLMEGVVSALSNISYYPPTYSSTNVVIAGATTNYTQLESYINPGFNQTTNPAMSPERIAFCGGNAIVVLNNIAKQNGTYFIQDGQTSFGLQFKTYQLSRGKLRIMEHPLFTGDTNWANIMLMLDLPTFNIAYLGDRKTQHKEYNANGIASDNGVDSRGGTFTTELTCEVMNPPANALITNLTAAAVG